MKNFLDFLNELKSETLLKAAEIADKRGHRGKAERIGADRQCSGNGAG